MQFEPISQACHDRLTERSEGWVVEMLGEVTPVREYCRRHGGIPEGFDDTISELSSYYGLLGHLTEEEQRKVDELEDRIVKMVPAAAQSFESRLTRALNDRGMGLPGWNNEKCDIDWRAYACFCYHAAGAADLSTFLAGDLPECPEVVLADPFYEPALEPPTVWHWIAGATIVAGVWWLFSRKG